MAKVKAMTQEWMDAYKAAIVADPEYKTVAKDWEGSVTLIVNPDPSKGVPETIYLFQDYWHGDVGEFVVCDKAKPRAQSCHDRRLCALEAGGPQGTRRHKALLQGKLKMKGDLLIRGRNEHQGRQQGHRHPGKGGHQWPDEA
jgi:hypothetical protein